MVGGRHWGVAALFVAAFCLGMPSAEAEERGPWGETVEDAGIRVNLFASDLTGIRDEWQQAQLRDEGPWFDYAATSICGARLPGSGSDDDLCRRQARGKRVAHAIAQHPAAIIGRDAKRPIPRKRGLRGLGPGSGWAGREGGCGIGCGGRHRHIRLRHARA